MDRNELDPDFLPPQTTLRDLRLDESFESDSRSDISDRSSRSITPFLRSTCHQHRGKR